MSCSYLLGCVRVYHVSLVLSFTYLDTHTNAQEEARVHKKDASTYLVTTLTYIYNVCLEYMYFYQKGYNVLTSLNVNNFSHYVEFYIVKYCLIRVFNQYKTQTHSVI
jgi:hypothetical protein